MRFYFFNIFFLLVSIVMIGSDEGSWSIVVKRLIMVWLRVLHLVEKIDNFFWCLLDNANEICLLVFAIYYYFGDLGSEFFILLACLWKVCYIVPKFATVFEVNKKLSDIGMGTLEWIAKYFPWAIELQFDIHRGITALSKRYRLRI